MMNSHQATNPPEEPNPWPCAICGYDTHDTNDRDVAPICDECIAEYYTCDVCGAEFEPKILKKNDACDECKAESWGE
jgi:predicted Zn-ribbon and HTH transcriptional regulator